MRLGGRAVQVSAAPPPAYSFSQNSLGHRHLTPRLSHGAPSSDQTWMNEALPSLLLSSPPLPSRKDM